MDIEELLARNAERLTAAADRAGTDPRSLLRDGFRATAAGVTAWVDGLGRLQRVEIEPGAFRAGEEARIATAVLEASRAALRAAQEVTLPADVQTRLEELESPQPSHVPQAPHVPHVPQAPHVPQPPAWQSGPPQPPAPQRPRRRDDPEAEDGNWAPTRAEW